MKTTNRLFIKPAEKAYNEVAVLKVAESPTYSYPLLAGDRLFVKDKESLTLMIIK
ncbi:MAG: hypothetical protein WCL21_01055 [Mariniphaga sp.]